MTVALALNEKLEKITRDRRNAPELVLHYEDQLLKQPFNKDILFSLIRLHLAEGCIPEAIDEIWDYLDNFRADEKIIGILLKLGHEYKRKELLVPVLEKIMEQDSRNASVQEILAGIYLDQKQPAKAIMLYERIVKETNDPKIYVALAELYLQHGHHEKSAGAYKEAIRLSAEANLFDKLEHAFAKTNDPLFAYLLASAHVRSRQPDLALQKYHSILDKKKEEAPRVLAELKEYLKAYPDYPEAIFLQSRALVLSAAYTEAVAVLNKAVRISETLAERVAGELEKILELTPNHYLALQSLAEIYTHKRDYAKVLDIYSRLLDNPEAAEQLNIFDQVRKIIKVAPNLVRGRELIAKSYFAKKNYRRAINEAEAILALDQNNAGAYYILGCSKLAVNEPDEAITNFRTALSLDPYDKQLHQYYQQAAYQKLDKKIMEMARQAEKEAFKYSLRYELGMTFFHRGLLNEAISEFQIAVKDVALATQVHKMQGICFKELGRYDLAIQQFQRSLEKADQTNIAETLKLQFYIGLALEAEGRHQEALQIYEEIMTQDINYENIQLRMEKLRSFSWVEIRGKALAAIIADPEAKPKRLTCSWAKNNESEEFNKKHKNRNADMSFSMDHNNKAVEHVLKGRWKAAEDELLLAEQMDPRFTIAYNNRAVLAMINGDLETAQAHFQKAVELNPKVSIVYANLGVLNQLRGDLPMALELYEKSLALDNTLFTTQINMGDLYYEMNNVQKAMIYWNKVLELGVVPELAKRRLKYKQA